MANEIGDVAQFRAISRRLKMSGFEKEEIDEDVLGVLEGMFGTSVGTELFELLKMAADNEFVEYATERAIHGINS
ncbi:hypothetical protein CHUBBYTHOR_57 [Shigella phage ChubbyThor]|nr:hypothetical protein CHUBBYTHOR_57 [Shigella phage ChubbyThor]